MSLDFIPSPDPERPGLLIRDPYRFSEAMLLIPPPLVACLACFDGEQTTLDLRSDLVRATGEIDVGELEAHLFDALSSSGFLEDEKFEQIRASRMQTFADAPTREPSHAGSGYPADAPELRKQFDEYLHDGVRPPAPSKTLVGIAAPHVSPFGGWESYRDAYSALTPEYAGRTFVVLGTSHYGEPERFGLTRKNFVTPYGTAVTDTALVDRLANEAGDAVRMEDYCHAVEHSIEFQIVFLQHLFGPDIRILPILCGSFARSIYGTGKPEDTDSVARFLGTLGEIGAQKGDELLWVLGVDMAHMGRRYGDGFSAEVNHGEMTIVSRRDRDRITQLENGDARGFWSLVQQNHDDLKWCGSAPIYTFLKAMPQARASLNRYQQWNIDPESVVSFAALRFDAP